MTAAHKSLPFGTCLVIGNPKTGRKVAVRVNDRGPFTPGVVLDLSSGSGRGYWHANDTKRDNEKLLALSHEYRARLESMRVEQPREQSPALAFHDCKQPLLLIDVCLQ